MTNMATVRMFVFVSDKLTSIAVGYINEFLINIKSTDWDYNNCRRV